jgi:hypothetical protein
MAKRYSTVTVTPTIVKANFDNNDVIGDFNRLPLPVRDGESCLLRSVTVIDTEHTGANLDIIFVKNTSGDTELGTSGGAVDITDANLRTNTLLGHVSVTVPGSDLITGEVGTTTDINLVLTSSVDQTITDHETAQTGCYFGIIARAASDTSGGSNDHLTFTFGFEIF